MEILFQNRLSEVGNLVLEHTVFEMWTIWKFVSEQTASDIWTIQQFYCFRARCILSVNHNSGTELHDAGRDRQCEYQSSYGNKVFLCKVGCHSSFISVHSVGHGYLSSCVCVSIISVWPVSIPCIFESSVCHQYLPSVINMSFVCPQYFLSAYPVYSQCVIIISSSYSLYVPSVFSICHPYVSSVSLICQQ